MIQVDIMFTFSCALTTVGIAYSLVDSIRNVLVIFIGSMLFWTGCAAKVQIFGRTQDERFIENRAIETKKFNIRVNNTES